MERLPVGAGNDEEVGAGNDEEVRAGNDEEVGAGNDEEVGAGNDESGTRHLPSFMLFNWAQRFLPTKPFAPVTRIFII